MSAFRFYGVLAFFTFWMLVAGAAVGTFIAFFLVPAKAAERVDVALILAVDHSSSVENEEWRLQLRGYADAFRSDAVKQTIAGGPIGRIAVQMFRWSSADYQQVIVPWTMIETSGDADAFADAIWAKADLGNLHSTCIAAALLYADQQFQDLPYKAERLVVDVSGDEPETCPTEFPAAREVRDLLVRQGVQINGLPIVAPPTTGYIYGVPYQSNVGADTERFYRESVIGGPGAFVVVAKGFHAFGQAVLQKLMLEIAGL